MLIDTEEGRLPASIDPVFALPPTKCDTLDFHLVVLCILTADLVFYGQLRMSLK